MSGWHKAAVGVAWRSNGIGKCAMASGPEGEGADAELPAENCSSSAPLTGDTSAGADGFSPQTSRDTEESNNWKPVSTLPELVPLFEAVAIRRAGRRKRDFAKEKDG